VSLAIEDFGNMFYPDRAFPAAKDPFKMHQTAHIRCRDELGVMMNMIGYSVFSHFYRDGFFRHAEGAAKTATLVCPVQLDQLDTFHHIQETPRFRKGRRHQLAHLRQMEPALTMTALVKTNPIREAGVEMVDLQYIGKEFDEFEDLSGDTAGLVLTHGMARTPTVQMFLDMQDTTAGRGDDVFELRKIFDEEIVTAAGEMFETRIGHGLSATGLVRRIDHFATQLFQQLQGGDTHLGIKLIDITGYE
jgi:hypothetical protein